MPGSPDGAGAIASETSFRQIAQDSRVASDKMGIYSSKMDISITEFKQRCLEIIRRVEKTGQAVAITRRGRVVARVSPSSAAAGADAGKPWEQVRALGGRLLAGPGESALRDEEFEALR